MQGRVGRRKGAALPSRRYKAMLVDMDGTLVRAHLELTPRVEDAVHALARRIPVGIVSSRDHVVVRRFAQRLGLDSLQVSEGGARIFHPESGETPWFQPMGRADAEDVTQFLDEHGLAFSGVDGDRTVSSTADIREWRVCRITAISLTPDQARRTASRFGARPNVHTAIIVRIDNGDWMVDFTHADATKATAVGRYAGLLGLEPSEIIGAGDSYNDLPLLDACGLRIAMGNAAPEVRAAADYVAPTVDEDGLAVAIEEFVMPALDRPQVS